MDLWLDVDFGSTKTGLSPGYRFYKADGTYSGARVADATILEIGGGCYGLSVTVPADAIGIQWDDGVISLYAHENIEDKRRQFDIEVDVDTVQTDLDNATDGLGAIKTAVDSIGIEVDTEVASILTAVTAIEDSVFNHRKWDKVGNRLIIYNDADDAELYAFTVNSDLSEITPE